MKYLHTMVRISSVDDSLDFYCNKLGLIELRRYDDNKGRKENLEDILWALLEIRKDLRQEKKWAAADRIRDRLSDLGIELQDSSSGTTWKIQ